jgi:hypothetical protein
LPIKTHFTIDFLILPYIIKISFFTLYFVIRRDNTLFRSIIFHWEVTVFSYALENTIDIQGLRSNIEILMWVHFCGFFFFIFFLSIGKRMGFRVSTASALTNFSMSQMQGFLT